MNKNSSLMETHAPLVSIITPIYNCEKTLRETIESVLAQSFSSWELLLAMDRGTTDSTPSLIQEYLAKDSRIKLIFIEDGRGTSLARNRALDVARGQYIAFIDSDDLWHPTKLEIQVQFMQEKNIAFSCTSFQRMSEDGLEMGHVLQAKLVANYESLLANNTIGCLTVMIDRQKTGPFHFIEDTHEDWHLWMKLAKAGHLCYGIQKSLAFYRIVKTSRSYNKLEMLKGRWYVLRHLENLSFCQGFFYFLMYGWTSLTKWVRF